MKCRDKLQRLIGRDAPPPKRLPNFSEVIVACQAMLAKIMSSICPRPFLVHVAQRVREKVANERAGVQHSTESAEIPTGSGQGSSAEMQELPLICLWPPKSPSKPNSANTSVAPQVPQNLPPKSAGKPSNENTFVAEQVGENVANKTAEPQGSSSAEKQSAAKSVPQSLPPKLPAEVNGENTSVVGQVDENVANKSAGEQSSSAVMQELPLIRLWPPKSPAKPNDENTFVVPRVPLNLPPKSAAKPNGENTSVAEQVGENVANKSAGQQDSSATVQYLPLIRVWPPKSPTKPNSEGKCWEKVSLSEVLSVIFSPAQQQGIPSTAAVDPEEVDELNVNSLSAEQQGSLSPAADDTVVNVEKLSALDELNSVPPKQQGSLSTVAVDPVKVENLSQSDVLNVNSAPANQQGSPSTVDSETDVRQTAKQSTPPVVAVDPVKVENLSALDMLNANSLSDKQQGSLSTAGVDSEADKRQPVDGATRSEPAVGKELYKFEISDDESDDEWFKLPATRSAPSTVGAEIGN